MNPTLSLLAVLAIFAGGVPAAQARAVLIFPYKAVPRVVDVPDAPNYVTPWYTRDYSPVRKRDSRRRTRRFR
jgi:hypothetical protein